VKQKKKGTKFYMLLAAVLFVIVAATAVIAKFGGGEFFHNYGENFKKNAAVIANKLPQGMKDMFAKPTQEPAQEPSQEEEKSTSTIGDAQGAANMTEGGAAKLLPLENAGTARYARYKDSVVCASQAGLTAFDLSGKILWTVPQTIVEPILDTADKYILLAEKGGKKVSLFSGNKLIYTQDTENAIITASISENGDVVVVTEKPYYKGAVIVYNKDGKQVFVWNSGSSDIMDADISSAGRKVAVAMLNTDHGTFSTISFFDLTGAEPEGSHDFDDTLVFDVDFLGETLNVVADNKIVGLNTKGKELFSTDYNGKKLSKYSLETSGLKALMFDNSSYAEVAFLDNRGRSKLSIKSEEIPDFVDLYAGMVAYNTGQGVVFGSISGKDLKLYRSNKGVKNALIVSTQCVMVIYSSSVEFVTF
jgi:hypothetical protein